MNHNYIINANISALNHTQISVENGLINSQTLTLGGFDTSRPNGVTFRARNGINVIGDTKLNIWKGNGEKNFTLFLPENNGQTNNNSATIVGGNQQTHTQSIIGIGGLSKLQSDTQQLFNSQCYLIPPSIIPSNISELQGPTLFETIGEQTENIRYLAGYPIPTSSINELRNSLVPTVGQIVDLLKYLDTHMNGNQNNLASTYS